MFLRDPLRRGGANVSCSDDRDFFEHGSSTRDEVISRRSAPLSADERTCGS
jgi:hypothetical protein